MQTSISVDCSVLVEWWEECLESSIALHMMICLGILEDLHVVEMLYVILVFDRSRQEL